MDEAGVTRELQESGEGEGGDGSSASPGAQGAASRVSALVDRGQIRLVNGDYDGARDVRTSACVCFYLRLFLGLVFLYFFTGDHS